MRRWLYGGDKCRNYHDRDNCAREHPKSEEDAKKRAKKKTGQKKGGKKGKR